MVIYTLQFLVQLASWLMFPESFYHDLLYVTLQHILLVNSDGEHLHCIHSNTDFVEYCVVYRHMYSYVILSFMYIQGFQKKEFERLYDT